MASKQTIKTDQAPAPVGPYSQAVIVGELVFISGQVPLDPETGELVEGGVQAQTKRVMESLKAILETAGSSFDRAVKVQIFLKDMNDFGAVNEIYASYFGVKPPARFCVEVPRLPKDVLVEMDMIAHT